MSGYQDDEDKAKMGEIVFAGKDINQSTAKFDRLALSGRGELLMVSVLTETQRLKQIRALLAPGSTKSVIEASGIKIKQPSQADWYGHAPGRIYPTPDGYQCFTHKLGYGLVHAMFLARMDGFMKVVTPESLWQELNHVRFTTPILREWLPYLEKELRERSRLEEAHVFNCVCGILSATTKSLDEIVTEGLQKTTSTSRGPPAANQGAL
jgi:hypothetical protein